MPTPVADIVLVRKQVLEHLLASPRAARYTDAIGDNSEFEVLQEISDFILLTDETLCQDIISTEGNGWRSQFMVPSSALNSGDFVPSFTGEPGEVQVALIGIYRPGIPVKSRDEILRMLDYPAQYPSRRFYFLQDSIVYHTGDTAKVWYPVFTRTAVCQSPQTAEPALIWGAISMAEKIDSESPFFAKFAGLFQASREYVKKGDIIPPQIVLEEMLARGPQQRSQEAAA